MTELGTFEGLDVIQVRLKLGGKATGLNELLAMKPETHGQNEEVYLVVRGKVKVGFDPIPDTDCLARIETVKIYEADFTTAEHVNDLLEKQALQLEEARGIQRLALLPNQAAIEAHERGEHAGPEFPFFGCPLCDEEEAAAADEAREADNVTPINGASEG